MENEKKRIKLVAVAFVVIAVALIIQLAIAFATAPSYKVNICRDEDCENFAEYSQYALRENGEHEGMIYVFVFERGEQS